jgi:hypothetical protein
MERRGLKLHIAKLNLESNFDAFPLLTTDVVILCFSVLEAPYRMTLFTSIRPKKALLSWEESKKCTLWFKASGQLEATMVAKDFYIIYMSPTFYYPS